MTDKNPLAHYSGVLSEAVQESAAANVPASGAAALSKYLETCEQHAIVPDVGGAFASAFAAGFNLATTQAAPIAWPKDAQDVRDFFRSDFISAKFPAQDQAPCDEDQYLISAHDFLSAVNWWANFPHVPRVDQAAPLPLLIRDIARDLGITALDACRALKDLGNYSVNMAVTAEMAAKLRELFPVPQAAPAAVAVPDERAAFEKWASFVGYSTKRWQADANLYEDNATEDAWIAWQARAALAATPAAAPAGWKLAPDEPTSEMNLAMHNATRNSKATTWEIDAYKAALAAAPAAAARVVLPEPDAAIREVIALVNQAVRIGQEAARHDFYIRPTDCVKSLKRLDSAMLTIETKMRALLTEVSAPTQISPEWEKVRRGLTMVMLGLAGRPDCSESAIEAALDAVTEPGMPLAGLRALAGVSAPAAQAVPVKPQPITLTVNQLRQAIEFGTGDFTPDTTDELETQLSICWGSLEDDDGNVTECMRCWLFEYPEEGAIPLDEQPTERDLASLATPPGAGRRAGCAATCVRGF